MIDTKKETINHRDLDTLLSKHLGREVKSAEIAKWEKGTHEVRIEGKMVTFEVMAVNDFIKGDDGWPMHPRMLMENLAVRRIIDPGVYEVVVD